MDREVRFHLEMESRGERPARDESLKRPARRPCAVLAGSSGSRRSAATSNATGPLETLWQDARFGARVLRRNPGFTLLTVLTLAWASARTRRSSAWFTACCCARCPIRRAGSWLF